LEQDLAGFGNQEHPFFLTVGICLGIDAGGISVAEVDFVADGFGDAGCKGDFDSGFFLVVLPRSHTSYMSSPAANPPPKNKAPDLPLWNRWWLFWKQVVSRFERKGGFIHASSLSYTTLVGLIPVLAVGLSVATSLMVKDGDEGQKEIEEWIDTMVRTVAPMLDLEVLDEAGDGDPEASGTATNEVAILEPPPSAVPENFPAEADPGQPDTIQPSIAWNHFGEKVMATGERRREVARQIAEYVERIHTGTIGVTSVCVFLVVAILLLRAIERTFNQVWEIPRNRSWGAGVAQYWAGLTLGPFLLILGTGLSSGSTAGHFMNYILEFGRLGNILIFILAWCITGSACALVYRIMNEFVYLD